MKNNNSSDISRQSAIFTTLGNPGYKLNSESQVEFNLSGSTVRTRKRSLKIVSEIEGGDAIMRVTREVFESMD